MIVPFLTLLFGGAGGYFIGRARNLESEREADEERKRLEQKLAQAQKALPSAMPGRPLPPIPKPGEVVIEPEAYPQQIPAPGPLPSEPYRQPDTTAVIKLPVDAEDFDQLGDAICACYSALKNEAAPGTGVGSAELRDCLLNAVYPDFQWPPVPGDPVEAQLMWMIADHESRKALAGSELENCPPQPGVQPTPPGPPGLKARG